jgi:hypothetical protein
MSSAKPAVSKPWSDVVALGDRIVRELALDDSVDTLGRWMAHRVAELIDRANKAATPKARNTAAADAADLVLRLWAHRSNWPKGWPPPSAAKVLGALDPQPYAADGSLSGSPWVDSLHRLADLHTREQHLWIDFGLLDLELEAEQRALSDEGADLREDEREVLERLVRRRNSAAREHFDGTVPASSKLRAEVGRGKLAELEFERQELVAQATGASGKVRRRPSRRP